jgi:hypothetical protein
MGNRLLDDPRRRAGAPGPSRPCPVPSPATLTAQDAFGAVVTAAICTKATIDIERRL